MNPIVEQQLRQITALVEELRLTLVETKGLLKEKQQAYSELTQKYWGRGKEIAIISRNEEEFRALSEENERLHAQNRELQERLERILAYTKALSEEFRS